MPPNTTKTRTATHGELAGQPGYTELCESITEFKRDIVSRIWPCASRVRRFSRRHHRMASGHSKYRARPGRRRRSTRRFGKAAKATRVFRSDMRRTDRRSASAGTIQTKYAVSRSDRNATCCFAGAPGGGGGERAIDVVKGGRSPWKRSPGFARRITVGGRVANLAVQRPGRSPCSHHAADCGR